MQIYHRINSFLLERFPTLWNTRLIWMLLIGGAVHCLFFVLGYWHLDLDMMKEYNVREHFFKVQYFSVYLICCLMALIYFSFQFFAHNPFRHFYPLPRFYFWRVYGQLSLIMLVFVTVQISFENGIRFKMRKILPAEVLGTQIKAINLAYPFMYESIEQYHIKNRSYPAPFPAEELSNIMIGSDLAKEVVHGIHESKPWVVLNNHVYQFGHTRRDEKDSCRSTRLVTEYVDVASVYGLAEYSLYNFSSLYIESQHTYTNQADRSPQTDSIFFTTIAPQIHQWQKNRDAKAIEHALQDVVDICRQYKISCKFDPAKMAATGLRQDIKEHQQMYTRFNDEFAEAENPPNIEEELNPENLPKEYYSVDLQKFETMVRNVEALESKTGSAQVNTEMAWLWVFLSLIFAYILLMLKYVHIREILIGVVVCGMLIALFSLYYFVALDGSDFLATSFAVAAFLLLIIVCGFAIIWNSKASKSFIVKVFVPLSTALLIIFPIFYACFVEASTYQAANPCFGFETKVYLVDVKPWHFILLELPALQIIFALMKKIQGRAS